jgi:HD domain
MRPAVAPRDVVPLRHLPTLDAILAAHATALGDDFEGYRNHAYRVANLCAAQLRATGEEVEKVAVAAAFHDVGIWTEETFDYLGPSVIRAQKYLTDSGHAEWIAEISEMILQHHKLFPYRGQRMTSLVEPFRRADWIDVSGGFLTFGLPRTLMRTVQSRWPSAGFHKRLVALEFKRLRTHPWSPLPMVRL